MKLSVSVTNYSWADPLDERLASLAGFLDNTGPVGRADPETVTTALQDGESSEQLVQRCRALADRGLEHVVVIAPGRPLTDADLNCVARAADQLAGLAHTPG